MSDVITDKRPAGADRLPDHGLRQARLPRWAVPAFAAAAVALGCVVGAAAGLTSKVQWGLVAAALFLALTGGASRFVEGRRRAKDRIATALVRGTFVLAVIPLVSLLWETVARGRKVLNGYFLSHSMGTLPDAMPGGGIYHAIIGSVEQVGLATLIAAPIGLLTAVYLVEYGRGRLAKAVTFFVDVMTGIPSIVAGLFVMTVLFLMLGLQPFGFAGSLALAILMMPVVVRSTEEMLKLVPNDLREAAYALGVPKWRTILKVVLPTAVGGITTGVVLAIARITGETAPVLLLVFGNKVINNDPFSGAQQSLPLYVYQQLTLGMDATYNRAWAAALVLILFVMVLNLGARAVARWKAPKTGR